VTTDWRVLSRRAAFASHRLIGWIYWDPGGIERYAALGVPNGMGYYITTRAGALVHAGTDVVTSAYYSIHPDFIRVSIDLLLAHATPDDAVRVRDEAVLEGLRAYAPEVCDDLADLAEPLWDAADSLPNSGRVLYAAMLDHRRTDEPLLSAWLAVNCIREWRGDTHWAIQIADDLTGAEAGILDGAWRSYADDWLPKSRGADDELLTAGYERLERRGFARDGVVTESGVAHRQALEDRLDDLTVHAWQQLGAEPTAAFIGLLDIVGDRLIDRINQTAGELWMPAGRRHPGVEL
jgi:hypothetical protein